MSPFERNDGRRWRVLLWLAAWIGAMAIAMPGAGAGAGAASASRVALVLNLEGAIGPASADYVVRGIRRANEQGASVVVLRMDTPGGLDTSMREVIRAILASPLPVLTFVSPSGARAASAGTYILYASHIAAMAPGTNLGAATPVSIGGGMPFGGDDRPDQRPRSEDDDSRSSGSKDREGSKNGGSSDAASKDGASKNGASKDGAAKDGAAKDGAAKEEGSAAKERRDRPRGRDSSMEAKAINDAVAYIRSLAELRGRNADWAEAAVREAESLSASEAQARNVIDLVAANVTDLLAQADGRSVALGEKRVTLQTAGIEQQVVDPDWRSRLLAVLTNPSLALILMTIGFYGLIFEFMHPGAVYPGTIGAICLLVGLYALSVLPVNFAGLGLILLGLGLMVAEAFTPTAGAAAIGGAIAFVLGATILIDTEAPGFRVPWTAIGSIVAMSMAFSLLVLRMLWQSRGRPALTGQKGMIGERATVIDWSGHRGHVRALGERWNATAEVELAPGQAVRVSAVDGLVLRVTPEP